jgi:hypothetical protein
VLTHARKANATALRWRDPDELPLFRPRPETTDEGAVDEHEQVVSIPLAPAASGEKAKAHDILAAIRILNQLEAEKRAATAEERRALARFGGFGAVALTLFPDPVKGTYKDDGWQDSPSGPRSMPSTLRRS